jgi:hypothetical protein
VNIDVTKETKIYHVMMLLMVDHTEYPNIVVISMILFLRKITVLVIPMIVIRHVAVVGEILVLGGIAAMVIFVLLEIHVVMIIKPACPVDLGVTTGLTVKMTGVLMRGLVALSTGRVAPYPIKWKLVCIVQLIRVADIRLNII